MEQQNRSKESGRCGGEQEDPQAVQRKAGFQESLRLHHADHQIDGRLDLAPAQSHSPAAQKQGCDRRQDGQGVGNGAAKDGRQEAPGDRSAVRDKGLEKGRVAYGKFFNQKAGFISQAWFPHFANWRRDGYDFDSLWDEELASLRQKRIMGQFGNHRELFSFELKRLAGFDKGVEKNFEGTVAGLQMRGYLLIRDFRRRINKKGQAYGWHIAVYSTPEAVWGYEHIASAYSTSPAESKRLIFQWVGKHFPHASSGKVDSVLGWGRV